MASVCVSGLMNQEHMHKDTLGDVLWLYANRSSFLNIPHNILDIADYTLKTSYMWWYAKWSGYM